MLLFGLAVFLVWLLLGGRRPSDSTQDPSDLSAAEEEMRELDAFTTPEEASDDLPDWGPGAPRGR